jgi:lysophospholipid acyltransferase (LPLAT)-like uncharacterized protein
VRLKTRAITTLGGGLLTSLMRTARFEVLDGGEHYTEWWGSGRPVVLVWWHGRLLTCTYHHRHRAIAPLISRNRDGDYLAGVLEKRWGYRAIRGSSSRGGAAGLRAMVRTLRAGTAVAVTPDGPRGPMQKIKPGALRAAQLAGVPLLPLSGGAERSWWAGTWDRFQIPKPFSRVRVIYGPPIFIARDASPEQLQAAADRLEGELNELTERVDGSWDGSP